MKILLAPLLLAVSLPAFAEVDPKIHKLCIEAKDYSGCVKAQNIDFEEFEMTTIEGFGFSTYAEPINRLSDKVKTMHVIRVYQQSPAASYDLREGDELYRINDSKLSGMTNKEIEIAWNEKNRNKFTFLRQENNGRRPFTISLTKSKYLIKKEYANAIKEKVDSMEFLRLVASDETYANLMRGCDKTRSPIYWNNSNQSSDFIGCMNNAELQQFNVYVQEQKKKQRNAAIVRALGAISAGVNSYSNAVQQNAMNNRLNYMQMQINANQINQWNLRNSFNSNQMRTGGYLY